MALDHAIVSSIAYWGILVGTLILAERFMNVHAQCVMIEPIVVAGY